MGSQTLQKQDERLKFYISLRDKITREKEGYDRYSDNDIEKLIARASSSVNKLSIIFSKFGKSKPQPIRPLIEVDYKEEKFLVFDIETEHWSKFLCLGIYDIQNDFYKEFFSINDFITYTLNYADENDIKNIFAHNGGRFDFNFLIKAILTTGVAKIEKIIERGSSILSIEIKSKDKSYKLLARDSYAFIPFSLADAGKNYKVEVLKDQIDYKYMGEAFRDEDYSDLAVSDFEIDYFGNNVNRNTCFYIDEEIKDLKQWKRIKKSKNFDLKNFWYVIGITSKDSPSKYKIESRNHVLLYLKKDCVSLAQVIKKHFDSEIIQDAGVAYTSASQAIKIWRRYLDWTITPSSDLEDVFIRKAYTGGRTEVFNKFFDSLYDIEKNELKLNKSQLQIVKKQKGKTLFCYDCNSLYPTVMEKYLYPLTCKGMKSGKSDYDKWEYGVWHIKAYVPKELTIPPLGGVMTFENGTTKLVFKTGVIEGHFTKQEIEYAVSLGVKILEYREGMVYSNAQPIFKKFINVMYSKRLEAKKIKDSVTDAQTKLAMNSTYGKVGQNKIGKEEIKFVDELLYGIDPYQVTDEKGEIHNFYKMESDTSKMFSKVIIACYVTSYARILMHKEMMKVGPENIFYTDTDSIFTTKEMETGDELGKMKLEYESTFGVFLNPKSYLIQNIPDNKSPTGYKNKKAIKGVQRNKVSSIPDNEFVELLTGSKEKLTVRLGEQFLSFRLALKNGTLTGTKRNHSSEIEMAREKIKILENAISLAITVEEKKSIEGKIKRENEKINKWSNENYSSEKSITAKYDKRITNPDGFTTRPIHTEDIL